jgi:hypothetical protein
MLKAIETRYDGYLFRSRLEARWATFFNVLKVPYEYEKEGFDLGAAGYYLPDFWLPKQECWIEIKPVEPTDEEEARAMALAEQSGFPVFTCFGQIPRSTDAIYGEQSAYAHWAGDGWDNCYAWAACPKCGKRAMTFGARADYLCKCWDHKYANETKRLVDEAYEAARSARFEHGARPQRQVIVNGREVR